jgi:hypothetical protein
MSTFRAFWCVFTLSWALSGAVRAGNLDNIYDDQELANLQPRYERGWRSNYNDFFLPVFTAAERARFAQVRIRFEPHVSDREPFGFYSGGDQIVASTASLKFLFEITLAQRWLEMNGFDTATVNQYLTMVRYWDAKRDRPPKPLETLCIPPESSIDPKIVESAEGIFNDAAYFVLLHEYGHALYRHPGNLMVPPAESRANEEAADLFALSVFARRESPPAGVPWFFFVTTQLLEFSPDAGSASQRASLAARTHPVSPERLRAVARQIVAQTNAYAKGFKPGAHNSPLTLALEISRLANLLGDPSVQQASDRIGKTVSPIDLAPRPKGRNLSAPCDGRVPSRLPYDGTLRGKLLASGVEFNVDMVLAQNNEKVTGSFSYGNGVGRVFGKVQDGRLIYVWTLGADTGGGVMTAQNNSYRGSWGYGASPTGGGSFELTKQP